MTGFERHDDRRAGAASGGGGMDADAWRQFAASVADRLELAEGESVFEVGCGDGAFLQPMHEAGCPVGGLDPSEASIALARARMPDGRWLVGDAATLDPADPYAVVLACGSFSRFPDHEYARGVLARMAAKATRAVAILDVLDLGASSGPSAPGLCFDAIWFLRMLEEVGASAVQVSHQALNGEPGGEDRFHVFAKV